MTKTAIAFIVLVAVMLLPFGLQPLLDHLHLHSEYVSQAMKVWRATPEFYYEDLGMAKFFGPSHLQLLHSTLEAGTFLVPLIFLWVVRKKISSHPGILLAGFQLSVTFFYNFLDVTYLYLFYTPVIVSLVIAAWSLSSAKLKSALS